MVEDMPEVPVERHGDLVKYLRMALVESPDEFDLRPDRDGWYSLMDVMGAILDEPDFSWVGVKDVEAAVAAATPPVFEIAGTRIRLLGRRGQGGPPRQGPRDAGRGGDGQGQGKRRRRRRGRGAGAGQGQPQQGQPQQGQQRQGPPRSGGQGQQGQPRQDGGADGHRRRRRRRRHGPGPGPGAGGGGPGQEGGGSQQGGGSQGPQPGPAGGSGAAD